jgi:hypothetical protein
MSIAEFFGTRLPAALKSSPGFKSSKGTLAIIVEGAGSWTVQLGNVGAPVLDDVDDDADCIAIWTVSAFEALLEGARDHSLIAPTAIVGDEKLLARLGSFLQPAQRGGVGARLASLAA